MISKKQMYFISFLVTVFFVLVSTPYDWGVTFFGDSVTAWVIYYIVGFILGFYVTYVFIRGTLILINHGCEYFKTINDGNN